MGFFDKDAEDMLDIYLLETSQLAEQADEILLNAEKQKRLTREDINGIFRVMHTIKSSSAMMRLSGLSALAHRLEDIFDLLREDPAKIGQFDQEGFDLMFDVTGFIKAELHAMRGENYYPADAEIFDSGIQLLLGKLKEQKRYIVNIRFEKDCKMENIRAYMVVRQIKGLCSELETFPQNMETDVRTAEYIRQNGCYISFVSANPQEVLDKLKDALFVESCGLTDAMPQTLKEESETMSAFVPSEGDFIRVRAERLDRLQNLTGELMIAASSHALETDRSHRDAISRQMNQLLKELEELVISIRMVPFTGMIPQINRAVRDICKKEKKEVSFTVSGEDCEIDKQIADHLLDPLLHLIRNAVDHGIETPEERLEAHKKRAGNIHLNFLNASGEIQITISDDGRGMDLETIYEKAKQKNLCNRKREEYSAEELLELCLLPGFSTRETANEFSGRGVGLDVVRQMAEQFGGHIHVKSKVGEGSQFIMHLPLTLTIIDSIRFHAGDYCFALPSHQVIHFFTYPPTEGSLISHDGQEYWLWEKRYLPVLFLDQLYHIGDCENGDTCENRARHSADQETKIMIHIKGSVHEAALVVEQIDAQESLVEKPLPAILGSHYKQYTGISGCSLLGDGSICMQMDAEDLIRMPGGGKTWK